MTMGNNEGWLAKVLFSAGAVEILVGFLHFAMPLFVNQAPGFSSLSGGEIDFVTLSVAAVGILLVAFGSLTVAVAFHPDAWRDVLLPFLAVKSILWCSRVGLEIMFPVTIPLFHLSHPAVVVMPLLVLETLLFIIPAVSTWMQRNLRKS